MNGQQYESVAFTVQLKTFDNDINGYCMNPDCLSDISVSAEDIVTRKHVACDMLRRFCVASATNYRCKSVRILAERFLLYRT